MSLLLSLKSLILAKASFSARAASILFCASIFFWKSSSFPEMFASHHARLAVTSSGSSFFVCSCKTWRARAVTCSLAATMAGLHANTARATTTIGKSKRRPDICKLLSNGNEGSKRIVARGSAFGNGRLRLSLRDHCLLFRARSTPSEHETSSRFVECPVVAARLFPEKLPHMAALRRVFGHQAGPTAIGVLVPPGARTVVVVRPRSLSWDLLLIEQRERESVIRFHDFAREEAVAVAEAFARALDESSSAGTVHVETMPAPGASGHCVRVEVCSNCLIACPRLARQPYRPMVFATADEAEAAAGALRRVLCPPCGEQQEIYFNSRHFARS